jgi:hypothetical protein
MQQQIADLCMQGIVTTTSIMVGDRAVDTTAAHKNGLQAAGVLWGYGSLAELEGEHPEYLFNSPDEWSLLKHSSTTKRCTLTPYAPFVLHFTTGAGEFSRSAARAASRSHYNFV